MTIRITWKRAILTLLALGLAAFLFAASGLFNVAASSGHWKITDVVVHWVMQRSVATHSLLEKTPERITDDRGLVSAAGHYAQACASCHGAPGQRSSPTMQRASPPAPWLPDHLDEWDDRKLHWIVTHGVKMTGMPAWAGKDRPDEVARMVAFIRRLPTMTAAEYRALSGTDTGLGCASCHGVDGRGRSQPDIPILGGQNADYLVKALEDYATGRRDSAVMATAAAPMTREQMVTMAKLVAAQPGLGGAPGTDAAAKAIVEKGLPREQLPACASCHRSGGKAPVLAGQRPEYLIQRLRNWRGDEAVVDARKPQTTMPVIARRIPEDMIEPLARFYAGRQ